MNTYNADAYVRINKKPPGSEGNPNSVAKMLA